MSPALAKHIQTQQDAACALEKLLEAISALIEAKHDTRSLCVVLIEGAIPIARSLNQALDSVNLPK